MDLCLDRQCHFAIRLLTWFLFYFPRLKTKHKLRLRLRREWITAAKYRRATWTSGVSWKISASQRGLPFFAIFRSIPQIYKRSIASTDTMWRHAFTSRVYFHLRVFVCRPPCVPLTGVTGTRLEFSQRLHRQRMTPGSVGSVFIQEVRLFLNFLRAPHFLCTRGHPQTHQLCVCLSVMDVLILPIVAFLLARCVSLPFFSVNALSVCFLALLQTNEKCAWHQLEWTIFLFFGRSTVV